MCLGLQREGEHHRRALPVGSGNQPGHRHGLRCRPGQRRRQQRRLGHRRSHLQRHQPIWLQPDAGDARGRHTAKPDHRRSGHGRRLRGVRDRLGNGRVQRVEVQRDDDVWVRSNPGERTDGGLPGNPVVDDANRTVYVPENGDGEVSYFWADCEPPADGNDQRPPAPQDPINRRDSMARLGTGGMLIAALALGQGASDPRRERKSGSVGCASYGGLPATWADFTQQV